MLMCEQWYDRLQAAGVIKSLSEHSVDRQLLYYNNSALKLRDTIRPLIDSAHPQILT